MKKQIPVYDICTLSDYKQQDILISRFAPYLDIHHNLHLAHRHTFYHLVLFTQGSGTHTIDFEQFDVKPYQIYFMIPGQVHSWDFKGYVDGYVVNFSELFFQSFLLKPDYLDQFWFLSGNAADGVVNLPQLLQAPVLEVFEQLVMEAEGNKRQSADMIRLLLLQAFITIGRLGSPQQINNVSPYNYTLFKNFEKLIEKHYATMRLPKEYAELLYITPNHLNALCNDVLGMPAGEVIRNRIVLEAKRLLVNLQLSIAEIAGQLGFDDNSNFTKFFKKQTKLTPEDFRKNALNEIQS